MKEKNLCLMKRIGVFFVLFALVGLSIVRPIPIKATAVDPKDEALNKGAAWIIARQLPTGGWTENRDPGATSLALSALTAHAKHLDVHPLSEDYVYSENVEKALEYIFSKALREPTNNFVHWGTSQIYVLGPALMAISSVETPDTVIDLEGSEVDGMTHKEVVEEIVNFIGEAQVKSGPGIGLWYYNHPTTTGDMSIAGWTSLGLMYAKDRFDITIPQDILDNLDAGIDIVLWDDDPEHELYGGAGYTSSSTVETSYRYWMNIHKVGHLLSMMELVGDDINSERVQAALGFIERHFNAPNSGRGGTSFESPYLVNDYIDVGWRGGPNGNDPYPSYVGALTIMKGLLAFGLDTITVDEQEISWQDEFDEVIVETQTVDGYWQNGGYPNSTSETYRIYYTAWAMMTLLRSVPTIAVTGVSVSCPSEDVVANGAEVTLKATINPVDATNPNVVWSSSDTNIATVNNGVVKPISTGTVTITVTTEDGGFFAQCVINVKAPNELIDVIVEDEDELGVLGENLENATTFSAQDVLQESAIKLVVKVLSDDQVDEADKTLLEAFANENIAGDERKYVMMDVSLFKLVGEIETKLTSALQPITISFVLPEELQDKDFSLLRVHEGNVEELEYDYDTDTKIITFTTDKFSTYSLVYGVDIQIVDTSDQNHVGGWLLLLGISLLFASEFRKKEEMQ